jgi:naphthoate synthase
VSALPDVSSTFDPQAWSAVPGFEDLTDITYHRAHDVGAVRIAFDRPEVLNAFRPHTVDELYRALDHARMTPDVGVVLLTGNGPSPREGATRHPGQVGLLHRRRPADPGAVGLPVCLGGATDGRGCVDERRVKAEGGRLHILEVQRLIRTMPKVVIALVNGWAAGGGHSCTSCAT